MARRGLFVAVEGGDGAGKSGVIAAVIRHLEAKGVAAIATREPGGTTEGEQLRALLLSGAGAEWDPRSELLLMTAARVQHVQRVILPAVARGEIVVSDRFVGSTIAYQGAGRGLPLSLIRTLHDEAVGGLSPDLTLVLDVDPRVGIARSRRRLDAAAVDEGRFEGLDLGFHERVRASFLEQAAEAPERHAVIDASPAATVVQAAAIAAVDCLLA
ncbi:MAG: dTMP kinase [Hansschlegelia sp.]